MFNPSESSLEISEEKIYFKNVSCSQFDQCVVLISIFKVNEQMIENGYYGTDLVITVKFHLSLKFFFLKFTT